MDPSRWVPNGFTFSMSLADLIDSTAGEPRSASVGRAEAPILAYES